MGDLRLGLFDLPGIGSVLEAPSRPRKNRARPVWRIQDGITPTASKKAPTPSARRLQMLMDAARKGTEVMVKVTGVNKEAGALTAHLGYVAHKAEQVEDELGNQLDATRSTAGRVMQTWGVAAEEGRDNEAQRTARQEHTGELGEQVGPARQGAGERGKRPHDPRPTIGVHIMLSMPAGTNASLVFDAARAWATEELENHQYVMALHTDRDHPHVHIVANNVGYDMKRLPRNREDLQRWREVFAGELRKRGIEAQATPRKARGVIKKGERFEVRQVSDRIRRDHQEATKAGVPPRSKATDVRRLAQRAEQALNEAREVALHEPSAAERRARENRRKLEAGLQDAVRQLEDQGERGSQVAAALAGFLATLPPPETAMDSMKRRIVSGRAVEPGNAIAPVQDRGPER